MTRISNLLKAKQVDLNHQRFLTLLPDLLNEHRNSVALMRDGAIIAFYPTVVDAQDAGNELFADGRFSFQIITDVAETFGGWAFAIGPRQS